MSKPEFASADFTAGQLNAPVKIVGTENVPGILRGELKVTIKQPDLLRKINSVAVSGVKKFVVNDLIKSANIGWTGDNFRANFADMVEENVGEASLAFHCLEKSSLDASILAELGDKVETKLAYLFELLEKQSKGEQGILLTNGYANIVYVRDAKGMLWAVYAYWGSDDGRWGVGAYSVGGPFRWGAGRQFLSCDS